MVGELDARRLETERLDVGPAPAAMTSHSTSPVSSPYGERDLVVGALHVLDERARVDVDVLLRQPAPDDLGDVGVLGREHAVERLEQQDLGAQAPVRRGDLAPEAPAPRTAILPAAVSAHASSVPMTRPPNWVPGTAWAATGREHDGLGAITLPSKSSPTLTAVVGDRAEALDEVDLVLLEQAADAADEGLDDLLTALVDLGVVDGAAVDLDPKSPASSISDSRSATRRTALAGMQA